MTSVQAEQPFQQQGTGNEALGVGETSGENQHSQYYRVH